MNWFFIFIKSVGLGNFFILLFVILASKKLSLSEDKNFLISFL